MTETVERKRKIRVKLLKCAMEHQTIFYSDLAKVVGMSSRGPWKEVLDDIGLEETSQGRPDITYLVVNKESGLPGQISFEPAKPPTDIQRRQAHEETSKVFGYYKL